MIEYARIVVLILAAVGVVLLPACVVARRVTEAEGEGGEQ